MYTAKDVSMAHLAITQRMQPTKTSALFAEYFAVCQLYSDTLVARETHRQYIMQVDHLRMLLLTQRRQRTTSNVYNGKQTGVTNTTTVPPFSRPRRRKGEGLSAPTAADANVVPSSATTTGSAFRQTPPDLSAISNATNTSGASSGPMLSGRGLDGAATTTSSSSDPKRKGASISTTLAVTTPPTSVAASMTTSGINNNTTNTSSQSTNQKLHASGLSKETGWSGVYTMAASAATTTTAQKEGKQRRSTASGTSTAPKTVNVSSLTIVRSDCWGSEYYMETCYKRWNNFIHQLSEALIEPVMTWVTDNDAHPCTRSLVRFTSRSAYDTAHGMCFLRWSTWSEVKNYIDALHAVVNAPLSAFYTPLAIGLEVLGVPVLCLSLAPVSGPWNEWDQITPVWHSFCAMCATLRLMKPLKHAEGGRSDDVRMTMGGLVHTLGLGGQGTGSPLGPNSDLAGATRSSGVGLGSVAGMPNTSDNISALVAAMRGMSGVNGSDSVGLALRNSILSMGLNENNANNHGNTLWDAPLSLAGNNTVTATNGWSASSPGSPPSPETGVPTFASKRSVFYAGLENYASAAGLSLAGATGSGAGGGSGGNPFLGLQQPQSPQSIRSHAMQNSAVREDVGKVSPFVTAAGADARWYFIDARALTLYQALPRRSFVAGRMPRREMYGSFNGCVMRDCGPNEFVLQTKLRTIVSQLLNGFATNESILLSTLCHKHGVRYGPYVYTILDLLKAEEKQLTQALQLALRQGSSSPNVQARVQQCVRCIQAVLGELLARAVKHLIRHRWFTVTRGSVGWLARLQACAVAKSQAGQRHTMARSNSNNSHNNGAMRQPSSFGRPASTPTTDASSSSNAKLTVSMTNCGSRGDALSESSQGRITVVPDIEGSSSTNDRDIGTGSGSFQQEQKPLSRHDARSGQSDSRSDGTASYTGNHASAATPPTRRDSAATAVPMNEGSGRRNSNSTFLGGLGGVNPEEEAQLLKAAEAAQLERDLQDLEQPFIDGMLHVLEGVFQVVVPESSSSPPQGTAAATTTAGTPLQSTLSAPSVANTATNSNGVTSTGAAGGGGVSATTPVVKNRAYPPFNPALANVHFRPDVFEELLFLVNDLYIFRMYVADERTNEWQLVRRRAPVIMRRGGASRSRSANQRRRDGGGGDGGNVSGGRSSNAAGGGGNGNGGGGAAGGSRFLSSEEERITARPSELNAGWSLQCLQEIFGMPLIIRDGKIDVLRDTNGNIASHGSKLFEEILAPKSGGNAGAYGSRGLRSSAAADSRSAVSLLFSAPYATTLEIPLPLRLPSREKALEYAQEQRQIGLRICALSAQMAATSVGVERALHYARMGQYVQLYAADIRIACRGWPLSEDFDFLRRAAWSLAEGSPASSASRRAALDGSTGMDDGGVEMGTGDARVRSLSGPLRRGAALRGVVSGRHTGGGITGMVNTSAEDTRIQVAFQADMQYRLCLLNSKSDLREALRAWWSYSERAESLIKNSTAYGQVVRVKILLLLHIATTFAGPAVNRALEVAISDLDVLTGGLANVDTSALVPMTGNSLFGSSDSLGGNGSPASSLLPSGSRAAMTSAARFVAAVATTAGPDSTPQGSDTGTSSAPQTSFAATASGGDHSQTMGPPPPLMSPTRVSTSAAAAGRLCEPPPHPQLSSVLSINSNASGPSLALHRQGYHGTQSSGPTTSIGLVPPVSPLQGVPQGSYSGAPGTTLTSSTAPGVNRAFDLRAVQCAELYFLLLTSLVKHTLVPDASMTPKESVSRAITFCALRRELVVVCYGETSLEAAAAANDLGMLFMRDPSTHVAANEEFQRARSVLLRHLNYLRRLTNGARRLSGGYSTTYNTSSSHNSPAQVVTNAVAHGTSPLGDLAGSVFTSRPSSSGAAYLMVPGAANAERTRRPVHTAPPSVNGHISHINASYSTSSGDAGASDPCSALRCRSITCALGPSILRDTPIATSLFPNEGSHYVATSTMEVVNVAAADGFARGGSGGDVGLRTARTEVFETLLHVEKALHSVQNNIAFLYCYEAREQYYSSQLLFLEYVEEARRRGVITRPAVGEQLYAKRCQKKEVVEALLTKAEAMLRDILEKETEVPVFDYAVALNNMACVQLYRNHLVEARALITKSLTITARLCSTTATIPPALRCLHAEAALYLGETPAALPLTAKGFVHSGNQATSGHTAGATTVALSRLKAQAVASTLSPPLPVSLHPRVGTAARWQPQPASSSSAAVADGEHSVFPTNSVPTANPASGPTAATAIAAAPLITTAVMSADAVKAKLRRLSMDDMADVTGDVDEENLETEGETGAAILQCRITSLKILAQIDSQKHFIDRLRIQRLCAAHLAAWQSRRQQRRLVAARELRRVGLGALTRVYLAKRYRFSGHHFWMRQPAVYRPKLVTMHYDVNALTPKQQHDVWARMVENATLLLQRALRGTRERQRLGEQYQFCHYYLTRVRPAVEASIWGRMAQVCEVCMLHWLVGYGLLYLKEMREAVQTGNIWYITARDHFYQRVSSDRLVIQLSELAGREKILRDDIKSQEKRVRTALKYDCRARFYHIANADGMAALPPVTVSTGASYSAVTALTESTRGVGEGAPRGGSGGSGDTGGTGAPMEDGVLIQVNGAEGGPLSLPAPAVGSPVETPTSSIRFGDCTLVAPINTNTVVPLRRSSPSSVPNTGSAGMLTAEPGQENAGAAPPYVKTNVEHAEVMRTPNTVAVAHGTARYRHGREVGEGDLLREALRGGGGQSAHDSHAASHADRVSDRQDSARDGSVPRQSPLGTPDGMAPSKEHKAALLHGQSTSSEAATAESDTSSYSSKLGSGKLPVISAQTYKDRLRVAQQKHGATPPSGATTSPNSVPGHGAAATAATEPFAAPTGAGTATCPPSRRESRLSSPRRRDRVVLLQLENNQVRVPGVTSSASVMELSGTSYHSPELSRNCVDTSSVMTTASANGTPRTAGTIASTQPHAERKQHVDEMERRHREEERQRLTAYRERLAEGNYADDDTVSESSAGNALDRGSLQACEDSASRSDATSESPASHHHNNDARGYSNGGDGADRAQSEMTKRVAAAAQILQEFHFTSRALPLFVEAAVYQHTLYGYYLWPLVVGPLQHVSETLKTRHLCTLESHARDAIAMESSVEAVMIEMMRVHSAKGYAQLQQYRTWGEQTGDQLRQYARQLRDYYNALALAAAAEQQQRKSAPVHASQPTVDVHGETRMQHVSSGHRAVDPTQTHTVAVAAAAAQRQNNNHNSAIDMAAPNPDVFTTATRNGPSISTSAQRPHQEHDERHAPRPANGRESTARRHSTDAEKADVTLALAAANSVPRPGPIGAAGPQGMESRVPVIEHTRRTQHMDDYTVEFTPSSTTTERTLDENEIDRRATIAYCSNSGVHKLRHEEVSSVDDRGVVTQHGADVQYAKSRRATADKYPPDTQRGDDDARGRHLHGPGEARKARSGSLHDHPHGTHPSTAGARVSSAAVPAPPPNEAQRPQQAERHERPSSAGGRPHLEDELKMVQSEALRQALARLAK